MTDPEDELLADAASFGMAETGPPSFDAARVGDRITVNIDWAKDGVRRGANGVAEWEVIAAWSRPEGE